ncbi:YTH domain-containing family protein 2-like isoform X1 [Ctenocephalides felis]|uniref:YTH domain-containing family protein 2-like isoform X1 n=1 Tax=Ctenocephalides felis TaxID=7515 RepID=UPI000E6E2BA8|nr:YTH domain-containing family protein 2-like isoform X1 [Ctenocephalides felis]
MSAGVSDQRMKGQGNQAEHLESGGGSSETDFESWRHQSGGASHTSSVNSGNHTTSGAAGAYSATSGADHYGQAAGYYGTTTAAGTAYSYQAFGVSDGTWSNGTAAASGGDPMTFLGGYATHDSYGGVDAFAQPSTFNYFPGNGDYSTWGSHNQQRKPHYDDYYRTDQSMYAQNPGLGMPDSSLGLKTMEHGMQNLNLDMPNSLHGNQMLQNPSMGQMVSTSIGNKDKDGLKDKDNLVLSHGVSNSAPKKMTWASIASQPAKPQISTQSTGLKKKGPGMPPPPMIPGKHNMDIGTWDTSNKNGPSVPPPPPPVQNVPPSPTPPPLTTPAPAPVPIKQQTSTASMNSAPPAVNNVRPTWQAVTGLTQNQQGPQGIPHLRPQSMNMARNISQPMQGQTQPHIMQANHGYPSQPVIIPSHMNQNMNMPPHAGMLPMTGNPVQSGPMANQQVIQQQPISLPLVPHPVLDELRVKNNYNPTEFDLTAPNARFFVIKSYSEDDIHRSIKYEIWCSTEHGNKRLDQAYREREKVNGGMVYLFFSVNGSGHFCGMAQMVSAVDYSSNSSVWSQNKWKGQFKVRWIYVKDVPNVQLRHIRLENNENKPVTNSRDTQEVPHPKGQQVLRILHSYRHSTSIFDDFIHYEKRQEEEDSRKVPVQHEMQNSGNFDNKGHGDYGNDHKSSHHGGYDKHRGMRDHQNNSSGNYRDRGNHDMHGGYHHDNHQRMDRDNHHQRMDSRDNHHQRMDSRDNHHQRMDSRDHYRDGPRGHRDHDGGHGGHRMHHGLHPKDRGEHGNRGRGRGRNQ